MQLTKKSLDKMIEQIDAITFDEERNVLTKFVNQFRDGHGIDIDRGVKYYITDRIDISFVPDLTLNEIKMKINWRF